VPIEAASVGSNGADYIVREQEMNAVREKNKNISNDGSAIVSKTQNRESLSAYRKYPHANWFWQKKGYRKSRNKWARHDNSGIGNRHSDWKDLRDEGKI
jgi:hypothetical protein